MARARLLLLLLGCALPELLVLQPHKGPARKVGEVCRDHLECQSGCCVTKNLNPQKFCTSQTVFTLCFSSRRVRPARGASASASGEGAGGAGRAAPPLLLQPDSHTCKDHQECHSGCCTTEKDDGVRLCMPKTIFLHCLPWRKPNGDHCKDHKDCKSKCCIQLTEISTPRCIPRSGLLAQCLPMNHGSLQSVRLHEGEAKGTAVHTA
ncbi:leucine-rich colipase-like protein 1 [Pteropus alecto]|uniref:leucine-rich colipase-like protein 1 n=1 Tax=Pteropus alecto TaxID=9402 RepID=UPI000D53B001|nr:leucine-rich colipase-like protein 1 [Pteropus alecto]